MEDSLRIAEPVAIVRPRGAHRLEAFSPKLKRRLFTMANALSGTAMMRLLRPDLDPYKSIPPQQGLVDTVRLNEALGLPKKTLQMALIENAEQRRDCEVLRYCRLVCHAATTASCIKWRARLDVLLIVTPWSPPVLGAVMKRHSA
ncbi:hypothetical protein [Cupriavidus sp. 8B]